MVIDGIRHRTYQSAVEAVFGKSGGRLLAVIQYPNLVLTAIACELPAAGRAWMLAPPCPPASRPACGPAEAWRPNPLPPLLPGPFWADNITAANSMKYFAYSYKSFADSSLCTAVDEATGAGAAAAGRCARAGLGRTRCPPLPHPTNQGQPPPSPADSRLLH